MNIGQWIGIGLIVIIAVVAGIIWVWYRLIVWSADREVDSYWSERHQAHYGRLAEIDAMIEAGEPPLEILHKYSTTEEYGWAKAELAARGYRLQHEPFLDIDGYLVVEYVPMRYLEAQQA